MSRKTLLLLAALILTGAVSATVTLETGTELDPSNTNATYVMQKNLNFSQVTVFSNGVNLSTTNVSTSLNGAVKIGIWKHNLSENENFLYHYNTSANTDFYRMDSSKTYDILFNGSQQRSVTGQDWINVSVPGNTNLSVKISTNTAPSQPSNPSPSDGASDIDTPPTLSVDLSDSDGDSMDVTFYDASSDSSIGTDTSVSSGSTASVTWSGLSTGTNYSWYAVADDGKDTTQSLTFNFTTDYAPKLDPDQQYYTDFSVNHEFQVEAYANDTTDDDFESCTVTWEDSTGNTGSLSGNLDTSYLDSKHVKCVKNLSSSISDIEVGESITTTVKFNDGTTTIETSQNSHTVPNEAPTKPTSKTDLGGFLTDHTPAVQWQGESDPDGDSMTIKAYTSSSQNPTMLDSSGSASSSSLDLGQNIGLSDNTTYYYRLKVCDGYGKCSSYTSDDRFKMNEEPVINSAQVNDSSINQGDSLEIRSDVYDKNLESVNFTVKEGETTIIDTANGTIESGKWVSPDFKADEKTEYNWTVEAFDNVSESSTSTGSFSLSETRTGSYTRTFTESNDIRDVKVSYGANLNGQTLRFKANNSASSKKTLQNNTWTDITPGQDLTLEIEFEGNSTNSPELNYYNLSYRTNYKSQGYYKSRVKEFSSAKNIKETVVDEVQPSNTNVTYEYRTGSDNTPPDSWTDWKLCLSTCKPDLTENKYFQYRVNLTGTSTATGKLNSIKVKYK